MKSLKRMLKKNGQRVPLIEIIRELSPEGRASLKRDVEALVKRINLKVITKKEHIDRLAWLSALLYMLD